MKVSIIIPLYNKRRWVQRALDSIAAQTFTDYEILLVDDGSTDGGADNSKHYGDRRFRLITQPNAGPGGARNRGIDEAKGQLLAFLDADDEWLPDYLKESVYLLKFYGNPITSISSGYFEFPAAVSREAFWRRRGITSGSFCLNPRLPAMQAVYRLAYMTPCTTVVRTDIVRKWGGFYSRDRCSYGEDSHLWLKILLNETVAFHTHPLVRIHTEASSLSGNLPGPRPIEPFLSYPSEIVSVTPPFLCPLLKQVLAIRAFKTTCMLGYWGMWEEGKSLMDQFSSAGSWKLPYFIPARVCTTRLGAGLGRLSRFLLKVHYKSRAGAGKSLTENLSST
jgi:Glycosyl transferase family 2